MNDSRFNMWRAIVAMVHADGVVAPHEINFILEQTKNLPMSEDQRKIIAGDINKSGNIETFFAAISSPQDKIDFFHFARALSWSDGSFSEAEKSLIQKLKNIAGFSDTLRLMEEATKSFQDVYIEGSTSEAQENKDIASIIKKMLGRA